MRRLVSSRVTFSGSGVVCVLDALVEALSSSPPPQPATSSEKAASSTAASAGRWQRFIPAAHPRERNLVTTRFARGYAAHSVTSTTTDSLAGIASAERELDCYSRLYSARARLLTPGDVPELKRIFAFAREHGRRVTVRGGGHGFDSQALGEDLVVSMARFDTIDL